MDEQLITELTKKGMFSLFTNNSAINIEEAIQHATELPNSEGEFLNTFSADKISYMFLISVIHRIADKFVEKTATDIPAIKCSDCGDCCKNTIGLIFPLELHYIYNKCKFNSNANFSSWVRAIEKAKFVNNFAKQASSYICPFYNNDGNKCKIYKERSIFCRLYGYEKFYNDFTGSVGLYSCPSILRMLGDEDLNKMPFLYDKYILAILDEPALSMVTGLMIMAVGSLPFSKQQLIDKNTFKNITDKVEAFFRTKQFKRNDGSVVGSQKGIEILDVT